MIVGFGATGAAGWVFSRFSFPPSREFHAIADVSVSDRIRLRIACFDE